MTGFILSCLNFISATLNSSSLTYSWFQIIRYLVNQSGCVLLFSLMKCFLILKFLFMYLLFLILLLLQYLNYGTRIIWRFIFPWLGWSLSLFFLEFFLIYMLFKHSILIIWVIESWHPKSQSFCIVFSE